MNSFGNSIRLSIFGESHGAALGCTVDGLPAGFKPDFDNIDFELLRRRPRASVESTQRREKDGYEIISGFYNDCFTGSPFTVIFKNTDAQSKSYDAHIPRPSHADLAASIKFSGFNDPRGGGHFSGRLTLPLVFVGAIIKQLLAERGISIVSHIASIGDVYDARFDPCAVDYSGLDPYFPLLDESVRNNMLALLEAVRKCGDSVGATCEVAALGLPIGIGEPFFDSVESVVSHIVFSIPGIHALEFGRGFELSTMFGSTANDPISACDHTLTNNAGGINGGITNGMPLYLCAGFRPVPSIALEQKSIDIRTNTETVLQIDGRHDACILPRGLCAVEAALAIGLYDLILRNEV